MLWGTCLNSLSFVCGVNYRETSSEELGGILGRKGKELGKGNGKETPESLSTETLQGVYMAKIISGIDRYHCKEPLSPPPQPLF